MKNLGAISPDLRALERWIASRADLRGAWLFGSRARGDARSNSDVDIAIWLTAPPPNRLQAELAFQAEAAAVMGISPEAVDVISMDHCPPLLRQAVFRDGRLLLDRTPADRVNLQVRTLNEAEQARHLWEMRRLIRSRQLGAVE